MIKRICAVLLLVTFVLMIPCRETDASSGRVSVGDFLKMLKSADDRLDINTNLNKNKRLTFEKAAVMLVKGFEILYRETPDEKKADYILKERISDADSISPAKKKWVARAFALGLMAGKAEAPYSAKRVMNPKKKCTVSDCKKMIDRLIDPELRYKLSPDFQILRIDTENRPVMEAYYSYILDNYPNGYYDCMFNFMVHQPKVFEAADSPLWDKRNCTDYCGVMTWDTTFSKLTYEDRINILCNYTGQDRLELYCAYLTPAEYDIGAAERNKRDGYLGMALTSERKRCMADTAKEYVMKVMNVDYRTIAKDSEWREYMKRCGISEKTIDAYIEECIKDELILECDFTAADISGIYFDRTPFAYTKCMGVVHTYAHYRVVSDNGKGFPYDELTIVNGEGRQCLRNARISDDGLSYIWVPENDWQDGYFDIGMANDNAVYTSIFDIMRYKAIYIAAFGYPCETPCYYPGAYTVAGAVKFRMTNRTKEEYLNEWGYIYCR